MALKVTNWNWNKLILITFDMLIILINFLLFVFISNSLYKEYITRSSLDLFIIPFFISLFNVIIDIIMNKTNIIMKYAGHNRYGMIIRFFMFYCVLLIIIFSDQKIQYLINETTFNNWIFLLGLINIGLILLSMMISFCVIDQQNINEMKVRRSKKNKILEEMDLLQKIVPDDSKMN